MKISESMIQKSIMDLLKWKADTNLLYHFRAGSGKVRLANGKHFHTGRPGCPDIMVLFEGRYIGLEVKTKTGKQSENQNEAEADIKRCGGEYYIVRSVADVKSIFGWESVDK